MSAKFKPKRAEVLIPGQFIAHYDGEEIAFFTFTPAASHPGYFGPPFVVMDNIDEIEVEHPRFLAHLFAFLAKDPVIAVEWVE